MDKEYQYYVSYAGSRDTCLELHTGTVCLPTPIETDDDVKRIERMINTETGDGTTYNNDLPALLGIFLLRVREVEKSKAAFKQGYMAGRICT